MFHFLKIVVAYGFAGQRKRPINTLEYGLSIVVELSGAKGIERRGRANVNHKQFATN